ncbi:MAG: inorganic phosphate transporter [Bacteroidales bacterium]
MENIYLFFVVALFILAISDLVVGVGNDAVNFLNSAIGSKVASFKVIMGIAAIGVLFGATFSSGMMEVARSGVFFPDKFYFNEIMILFLAVMITDIILLDAFNTFGLPTSTTVSIVFELLGAAVAVALFKVINSPEGAEGLNAYINSARALTIISGILLSVVISFTVGAIVQFFSRMLFTFNIQKSMPYFGAIWGSIAITAIIHFILVKGAKGASFMTPEVASWIMNNTFLILSVSFITFGVFSQILISVFKVNIFKVIVLIGTFSIAMAFAGNDLVNFIGVPLAGYDSYMHFIQDPTIDPTNYTMESLLNPVQTPTLFLLIAGVIMILALFFSKKARSVTQTEVDLARQEEGYERFSSSMFAKTVVRNSIELGKFLHKVLPAGLFTFLDRRFQMPSSKNKSLAETAHFDQLRASVNMFIASILISFATSLKLPLSTTYVTFMVAMGTSLADRAWGRESAVYRITGVLTVIGGWFFTAFSAFSVAFLFALFISWGGVVAGVFALLVAFFFLVRTNFIHKKRSESKKKEEDKLIKEWDEKSVMNECKGNIVYTLEKVEKLYGDIITNFMKEHRKKLKKNRKKVQELNDYTKTLKKDVYITLKKLQYDSIGTGHHYVQVLDYLREIAHCINFIVEPIYEHIDNNHPAFNDNQEQKFDLLSQKITSFFQDAVVILKEKKYDKLPDLIKYNNELLDNIEQIKVFQIKLIKEEKVGTRNSMVVFNLLTETKNILLHTVNVLKSHRDFTLKNHL